MACPPLRRILYVEDDPDIQAVAEMALTRLGGFELQSCTTGTEAVAAAARFAPDLILLDRFLPGMNGFETLAELRRHTASADIPVIFFTGRAQLPEIDDCLARGAIGVILKPFDPMSLHTRVMELWKAYHDGLFENGSPVSDMT